MVPAARQRPVLAVSSSEDEIIFTGRSPASGSRSSNVPSGRHACQVVSCIAECKIEVASQSDQERSRGGCTHVCGCKWDLPGAVVVDRQPGEASPPKGSSGSGKLVRFGDCLVTGISPPPAFSELIVVSKSVEASVRRRAVKRARLRALSPKIPRRNLLRELRREEALAEMMENLSFSVEASSEEEEPLMDLSVVSGDIHGDHGVAGERSRRLTLAAGGSSSGMGSPSSDQSTGLVTRRLIEQPNLTLHTTPPSADLTIGKSALSFGRKVRLCAGCNSKFSCGRCSRSSHCPVCRGENGELLGLKGPDRANVRSVQLALAGSASGPKRSVHRRAGGSPDRLG